LPWWCRKRYGHKNCIFPAELFTNTTDSIDLPAHEDHLPTTKTLLAADSLMKKILVIDDEEWLREMVHMALQQKGYEVVEAPNGSVGIELARKELPDLVLCDVNMEKVDGYLTLSSLRSEPATASIPFILMTGLADNAGMRHGMELGADDYLPKPFTIDNLYAAVEARLKKAQTVREDAERKLADLRDSISMALPHELRTPLNGIIAYGEILSSDAATLRAEEIAEMGQVIRESGTRLHRLVENFLIFAQLELLNADSQKISALRKKQTLNPSQIVEAAARRQADVVRRSEDLNFELVNVPVAISEEYLSKITEELVSNALKFSEPGKKICVSVADTMNGVAISVTDRGRGFSTEQITKIGAYMQFDRKMHEQQGLGLGLTIVKRLAELHGGKMNIQSEPQSSTSVSVKLPHAVRS
jgi:two-component system, sensor histidine kinase and response regulator